MAYSGWKLVPSERVRLLKLPELRTKYPEIVADHVTLKFGIKRSDDHEIPKSADMAIVGIGSRDGIQAAVVAVNGDIFRPDGHKYHITWSVNRDMGKSPKDSKALLDDDNNWERFKTPIPFTALPKIMG